MKVLLAVDGSERSLAAVAEVAELPWPKASVIRFVSVAEAPMLASAWVTAIPVSMPVAWDRVAGERALACLDHARKSFAGISHSEVEITTKVLSGNPKEAILDEADEWGADLLVVGTHGYNALERFWLGSVSRTITAHAKCSVHIARARDTGVARGNGWRILLAVDGSECGDAAVEEVASRPWPAGTEVRVLSAIHPPFAPSPEPWALPEGYYEQLESSAHEQADSAVSRAMARLGESNRERPTPLVLRGEAVAGHPEETIIENAKANRTDLIILGSHGYGGFERFLLGSVSHAVASHAPCSVEIVRIPETVQGGAS